MLKRAFGFISMLAAFSFVSGLIAWGRDQFGFIDPPMSGRYWATVVAASAAAFVVAIGVLAWFDRQPLRNVDDHEANFGFWERKKALEKALAFHHVAGTVMPETVVATAKTFETYLAGREGGCTDATSR